MAGNMLLLYIAVFGCRSSPEIWDKLSSDIDCIAQNQYRLKFTLHLLYDFLSIIQPQGLPHQAMQSLLSIFTKLNPSYSIPKTVGPILALEYLDVVLDSSLMETRLPTDKLGRLTDMINNLLSKSKSQKTRIDQYPVTLKLRCQSCRSRVSLLVQVVSCSLQCRSSLQRGMSQSWMQGGPVDVGSFVKTLERYVIVLRWRAHKCWLLWSVHWCLWNRLWGSSFGANGISGPGHRSQIFQTLALPQLLSKNCTPLLSPHCCGGTSGTENFWLSILSRRPCSQ